MVDFSSRLEILAEIKCKSENKGLIQASWLLPCLCRRSLPVACLKPRNQVWAPPWPSCQHWAGVQSQQENLLLRPDQGGLFAASQPGSKTSVGSRVCNLRPAWDLLFTCQLRGWFFSGLVKMGPGSGNGPRNRNSLFLWVGTWHLTGRGAQEIRIAVPPSFKDSLGSVLSIESLLNSVTTTEMTVMSGSSSCPFWQLPEAINGFWSFCLLWLK